MVRNPGKKKSHSMKQKSRPTHKTESIVNLTDFGKVADMLEEFGDKVDEVTDTYDKLGDKIDELADMRDDLADLIEDTE